MDEQSMNAACERVGYELGYKVERDVNLGVGLLDQVWSRQDHPNLPELKIAFRILASGGDVNPDVITAGALRALWSDCDHVVFLVPDPGTQKSIQGKVRAFDAIGGFVQLHKYITTITLSELVGGLKAETRTTETIA